MPQGIVLVGREPPAPALDEIEAVDFLLILDGLSDPGNAGTILRSAAAAGLSHIVFAGDAVDPFAGKVVRAGMGAHFRLRLLRATWEELAPHLGQFQVVTAQADAASTIYDIDWSGRTTLVIGSEAHGLSEGAKQAGTLSAAIPMAAGTESLNAAAVASIVLFHARRERSAFGQPN